MPGLCIDMDETTFNCLCMPGHTGPLCEKDILFCRNTTCMNGGKCREEAGVNVSCVCPDELTGLACEIDLNFCNNVTCFDGGTCQEGRGTITH